MSEALAQIAKYATKFARLPGCLAAMKQCLPEDEIVTAEQKLRKAALYSK